MNYRPKNVENGKGCGKTKRCLSTCTHISSFSGGGSNPYSPQYIASIISAEISDPDFYPEMHQLVCARMMHGPCGTQNPNNVCMDKGQCTKSFPKPFQAETSLTDTSPTYKRPDNRRTVVIKGATLDNRWVVPYNSFA